MYSRVRQTTELNIKTMKFLLTFTLLFLGISTFGQSDIEKKIDAKISKMSLADKIGQLNQVSVGGSIDNLKQQIRDGQIGSIMNVTDPKIANELQKVACEESPGKIPIIFGRDVIHGFKTMFPIPLGQAASFNPEIVKRGTEIAAIEASEHGIKWAFAPMVDISRDPRWGRIAESFGEDPYLTGEMGLAVVQGYQGRDLKNKHSVAATAKHFVGYGAAEGGRDYNTTYIPQRQLHNTYLPPFKRIIDGGCATVMTSFNSNDGIPATGDKYLLTNILRDGWKFDGVVFSDWNSVGEMVVHGFAESKKDAALKAIKAGLDIDMSAKAYLEHLEALLSEGMVSIAEIDNAVRNTLRLKYRLGLFENPYTDVSSAKQTYSQKHLDAARIAAEQSMVLLKNEDNILPLNKNIKNILVVGPLADAPHDQMGTWTMDGEKSKTVTPIMALRKQYGNDINIEFIKTLDYSRDNKDSEFDRAKIAAKKADVILAFIGEEAILSGEGHSLANLDLRGKQSEMIDMLSGLNKPLVTIVMAGRPMTIAKEFEKSNAFIYAWHPGTMGGEAITNILFGVCNPGGKLPVTFPKEVGQVPIYYNHEKTGRPSKKEVALDKIPVEAFQSVIGRSSNYLDLGSKPFLPFGYGLSYTTFEISNMKLSANELRKDDVLSVSVDVQNTGKVTGDEVVQLYITDLVASITRPVKELKGFERITLEAGEKKTIKFDLPMSALAFCNVDLKHVVESGEFSITVGQDSNSGLTDKFSVK